MTSIRNACVVALAMAFVFCPSLAQAQNKIIVIKRDGSSETIDLPDNQPIPDSQEILKRAEELKKQLDNDRAAPPKEPELSAEELMREAPIEEKVEEPEQVPTSKPSAKPSAKPKAPAKKAAPKPQPQAKKVAPVPEPKPSPEEIEQAINAKPLFNYIDPANIPAGTAITRDLAIRAALEVAPASRGFDATSTTYEGRPAWQVRFKTEGGPHDIIVDGETGKVLFK